MVVTLNYANKIVKSEIRHIVPLIDCSVISYFYEWKIRSNHFKSINLGPNIQHTKQIYKGNECHRIIKYLTIKYYNSNIVLILKIFFGSPFSFFFFFNTNFLFPLSYFSGGWYSICSIFELNLQAAGFIFLSVKSLQWAKSMLLLLNH